MVFPTPDPARIFTQDSRAIANRRLRSGSYENYTQEGTPMSFTESGLRARYARVLYAAAVAALLTACSQSHVEPATTTTIHLSEASSDMPEVVVTTSRVKPENIG